MRLKGGDILQNSRDINLVPKARFPLGQLLNGAAESGNGNESGILAQFCAQK